LIKQLHLSIKVEMWCVAQEMGKHLSLPQDSVSKLPEFCKLQLAEFCNVGRLDLAGLG
jgi:hypothetical protein